MNELPLSRADEVRSGHFAAALGHERSECNPLSSVNSETVGPRIGSGWRD
jgi:hypothetical protein